MENEKKKGSINEAIKAVDENKHQDLIKENLGNEPEEQTEGQDNKYKLEGYEDKRPEDPSIKKGWTVDSNTSRGPQDID
ncbi:hypothetical protein [Pedobacter xixiisoli]|uniref:Uncharacterized protein n=1 Tax=Pedobacter xixiisoli TaxID=1476464 RepID=A0A285ZWN7_9SPHI|nr:hypothetical protein [Pedobacter xixiisoli]SOD14064.1 hypothetical protein SAMN06297358_1385 [Pedobacter xixiisoli]